MQAFSAHHRTWAPRLIRLNFDPTNPTRFARTLTRCAALSRPRLLINCEHLVCLRTHGVAHFVSHLLLLHHSGATVILYNVSPALFRLLHLLRLDTVLRVNQSLHGEGEEKHI